MPITRVFPGVPRPRRNGGRSGSIGISGSGSGIEWSFTRGGCVGPLASTRLVDHGVLWPPKLAGDRPSIEVVPGGSLIDGEGGDEVLGDDGAPRRRTAATGSVPVDAAHAPPAGRPRGGRSRQGPDVTGASTLGRPAAVARAGRSRPALAALVGKRRRVRCATPRAFSGPPEAQAGARGRDRGSSPPARMSRCRARCCTRTSSTRWPGEAALFAPATGRPRCATSSRTCCPTTYSPGPARGRTPGASWAGRPGVRRALDRRGRGSRAGRRGRGAAAGSTGQPPPRPPRWVQTAWLAGDGRTGTATASIGVRQDLADGIAR